MPAQVASGSVAAALALAKKRGYTGQEARRKQFGRANDKVSRPRSLASLC